MFNNTKNRTVEIFIFDIYIAILKIKKVASKFNSAKELLHSFTDWDSVIREFEIIGESTKYLLKSKILDKDFRKIVDFRNYITHEYFGIDEDIVWMIIEKDLKKFESVILNLINDIDPKLKQTLINDFIKDNEYLDFIVKKLKKL